MQLLFVRNIVVNLRVFLMLLLVMLLSLYVSWMANANIGYGYSWLYHAYQIDAHIEQYAPQNKFRSGFELTTDEDHKRIFQQIVDSVHGPMDDSKKSLSAIQFTTNGKTQSVLHRAEIIHLYDVAVLIQRIHILSAVCFVLLIVLFLGHYRGGNFYKIGSKKKLLQRAGNVIQTPSASSKGVFSVLLVLVGIIALVFWRMGAKNIFYQMHIWIFPDNHQWFFYYQDSLMSTLMKAPDLFGGMAVQILLLGIAVFSAVMFFFSKSKFKK